jgi:phospholipid N-methyltransferase
VASQSLLFARNFFKHPKMLGSFIPSSPFLIKHLISQIDFSQAKVIVEYGPGVGTISQELLERMSPDARLVLIEMNRDFVIFLKQELADPRVHVVQGSAENVRSVLKSLGLDSADYIVSGIPYSTMPDGMRRKILSESKKALSRNGQFLVYQFTRTVLPHLQVVFRSIRQDFELLNILPARLFYCSP